MTTDTYNTQRRENDRYVRKINAAWGASVAWVEDREVTTQMKDKRGNLITYTAVAPVIASKMVRGLVDGLEPPPFQSTARVT